MLLLLAKTALANIFWPSYEFKDSNVVLPIDCVTMKYEGAINVVGVWERAAGARLGLEVGCVGFAVG